MDTVTVSSLLSTVGTIFTSAIGWVGTVASTVASQPLLLLFVLLPLCGIGIGFFTRLINIRG